MNLDAVVEEEAVHLVTGAEEVGLDRAVKCRQLFRVVKRRLGRRRSGSQQKRCEKKGGGASNAHVIKR